MGWEESSAIFARILLTLAPGSSTPYLESWEMIGFFSDLSEDPSPPLEGGGQRRIELKAPRSASRCSSGRLSSTFCWTGVMGGGAPAGQNCPVRHRNPRFQERLSQPPREEDGCRVYQYVLGGPVPSVTVILPAKPDSSPLLGSPHQR